jgi:hypothetical protein
MNQRKDFRSLAAETPQAGKPRISAQPAPRPHNFGPAVLMLKARPLPSAPPVYKPQTPPQAIQPRMPGATSVVAGPKVIAAGPVAPPVYRPTSRSQVLQQSQTIQLAPCQVCHHTHGSTKCKTLLPSGKKCGCTSHSSHWGKGSKINPGKGKHGRKMAARKG